MRQQMVQGVGRSFYVVLSDPWRRTEWLTALQLDDLLLASGAKGCAVTSAVVYSSRVDVRLCHFYFWEIAAVFDFLFIIQSDGVIFRSAIWPDSEKNG